MAITHTKVTAISDDGSSDVGSDEWNDGHVFDGQLAYPATQSASADVNTLDDYEEGTWTPSLGFSTPGDESWAFSTQDGIYQKVGSVVHCFFEVQTSSMTETTAGGTVRLSGLPFTSASGDRGGGVAAMSDLISQAKAVVLRPIGGTTYCDLRTSATSAGAIGSIFNSEITSGEAPQIVGNFSYTV